MTMTTIDARQMSPEEFKVACAALSRPPPRRGIDMAALERVTQGRNAGQLNAEEYRAARAIIAQGDRR